MNIHPPRSLRGNIGWTLIGNLIYVASQWGQLVLLARLASPELIGVFTLGLATTTPVFTLASLNLRAIQATDALRTYLFRHFFFLRLMTTIVALAFVILVAVVFADRNSAATIVLVGLAKAFESLSDVVYGLCQSRERMDRISQSMMIRGPLSLVCLGITIYLTESLAWAVAALAASWGLVFLVFDVPVAVALLWNEPKRTATVSWRSLLRLAWIAIPACLVATAFAFEGSVSRWFVARSIGLGELGVFATMAYGIVAAQLVVRSVNQSALPRLSRYWATRETTALRRVFTKLLVVCSLWGLITLAAATLFGRPALTWVYGPEYAEFHHLLVWMMVAAMFRFATLPVSALMHAARLFWLQLGIQLAGIAVLAISLAVFIPMFGLTGAVASVAVGFLATGILYGVVAYALLKSSIVVAHSGHVSAIPIAQ